MHSRESLLIADLVIALVSVPMILQLVPPNRFYGFRTPRTLASPAVWYRANLFAGWALAIAAGVGASLVWLVPVDVVDAPAGVALFLVPLAVAVIASLLALRRLH